MIYFNGRIVEPESVNIHPADRGFLLADGLFETLRAYQGRVLGLAQHWQRLKRGADDLRIRLPLSLDELTTIISELLLKNQLLNQDACLRLTLTRGVGPRGLLPSDQTQPTLMLTAQPLLVNPVHAVSACLVAIRKNEHSPLVTIKSLNYLENILAKMAAVEAGAQEAILLNSQGHVAEASAANIFVVTAQGHLLTPRVSDGALPGITRQYVIDLSRKMNIITTEQAVSIDVLRQASEIFLTNSLIEIQPVARLDHKIMSTHNPITQSLQQAYAQLVD